MPMPGTPQADYPINTNEVPPFYMFHPPIAGHIPNVDIYYGFTNAHYPNAKCTLYHRRADRRLSPARHEHPRRIARCRWPRLCPRHNRGAPISAWTPSNT